MEPRESQVDGSRRRRWTWRLLGLAALTLAAVACTGSEAAEDAFISVSMIDNEFTRDVTRIPAGGEVRFRNNGATIHNAVAVDGAWSTEESIGDLAMQPGDSTRLSIDEPGVYDFYCTFHATSDGETGMVATLVVGDVPYQAAGGDAPAEPVTEWTGTTRSVPEDHPTIQNAVDAAGPGDLVLVGPAPRDDAHRAPDGEFAYFEQVDVTTPYLTIRGTDRNAVIVDGQDQRPHGINVAAADGVAVENMTVRRAQVNGVFFNNVRGFRGEYLTAYNNGIYGIYAFDSTDGVFAHSFASGSQDGAFYVGQCDPCEIVLDDVVAERSGVGYTGTNASGVHLINSVWRHNVGGIVPNTLDVELLPPVKDVVIRGNLVHDNGSRAAPVLPLNYPTFGNGITVAGAQGTRIERNRIVNHSRNGIIVTPNLSDNFWMSSGNEVRDNVIEGVGYSPITLSGPAQSGNCFAGNEVDRSMPPGLETLHGCDSGLRFPQSYELATTFASIGLVAEGELGLAHEVDYRELPAPPAQPQLPGGVDADVVPAVDVFARYPMDLDAIDVPPLPADLEVRDSTVPTLAGVPLTGGLLLTYFATVGWLIPFGFLAGMVVLVLIDLARRPELTLAGRAGWMATSLVVPFVGPLVYLVAGRPALRRGVRVTAVTVGVVGSLVLLVGGLVIGGVV